MQNVEPPAHAPEWFGICGKAHGTAVGRTGGPTAVPWALRVVLNI